MEKSKIVRNRGSKDEAYKMGGRYDLKNTNLTKNAGFYDIKYELV